MADRVGSLLTDLPTSVRWKDVPEFDSVDRRIALFSSAIGDSVGVSEGYIEWHPEAEEPSLEEKLLWLWVINPALESEILDYAAHEGCGKIKSWLKDF